MRYDVTIDELHEKFRYEPETGLLYRKKPLRVGFDVTRPVGTPWASTDYLRVQIRGEDIAIHSIAWAMTYGVWPVGLIDHIDRNRRNNRIANLRDATTTENTWNTPARGRIQAKGVNETRTSKFHAKIKVFRKQINLGTFDTVDEAAHAYNKAAIEHFGEFAVLNPIGADK